MTAPRALRDALEARARQLGFHGFGVAPATPLAEHGEFLAQWLAAGHAAAMDYLGEHQAKRSDPQGLLPGARSVICLLVDYGEGAPPGQEATPLEPGGRVARYARSRDYHIVLKKRLRKLGATLRELAPGAQVRELVDSAPLLERAYAWRAGLGFFGKNGMLLTPGVGSYTLLSELLTDVELEPDPPGQGTCGRCTRCLDACPTGALERPFEVDARRCISYWTIEHEGPLPPGSDLNGWAFGCDICQEVCPYNLDLEHPPQAPDFETPRAAGAYLTLAEVAALPDYAAFSSRFAGTPLMRPAREGMQRNLEACAGGDPEPRGDET